MSDQFRAHNTSALESERGPFVNCNSTTVQKDEKGRNGNQFAKFTKLHRLPKK